MQKRERAGTNLLTQNVEMWLKNVINIAVLT